jgi:hypothetical protein
VEFAALAKRDRPQPPAMLRSLQKYMHAFHADRDNAMCNSQNCTIPVVQLTQFQKLSIKDFKSLGALNSLQECQVLQYKVAAHAMGVAS